MTQDETVSPPPIVVFCHPGTRDAIIASFDSDDLDFDVEVYESPDVPDHLRWAISIDAARQNTPPTSGNVGESDA